MPQTKPQIEIYDTTLRDEEQGHPGEFKLEEKYKMALEIDKLGVDVIEAGFPAVHKDELELIKRLKGKNPMQKELRKDIK